MRLPIYAAIEDDQTRDDDLQPDELTGRCLICLEESDQQECDLCAERERRRWER